MINYNVWIFKINYKKLSNSTPYACRWKIACSKAFITKIMHIIIFGNSSP